MLSSETCVHQNLNQKVKKGEQHLRNSTFAHLKVLDVTLDEPVFTLFQFKISMWIQ